MALGPKSLMEKGGAGYSRAGARAACVGPDSALGPTRPSARRGPRPDALYGKCNFGNSRTAAPVACVCYDAALGPTRPSARKHGAQRCCSKRYAGKCSANVLPHGRMGKRHAHDATRAQ